MNDSRPLVLVLNPRWQGKLHGLNISYLKESNLKQLLGLVKETAQGRIKRLLKLRLPLLSADIGDPKKFYHSRLKGNTPEYLGQKKEHQEQFCINHQRKNPDINYYVFGHRHLPLEINITKNCKYINTGDWINHFSFAILDNENIELRFFKKSS